MNFLTNSNKLGEIMEFLKSCPVCNGQMKLKKRIMYSLFCETCSISVSSLTLKGLDSKYDDFFFINILHSSNDDKNTEVFENE